MDVEPAPADTGPDPSALPPASPDEPRTVRRPEPLRPEERRRVAIAVAAPIVLLAVGFLPFAIWGGATIGAVLGGAVVYGGLLSLAAGFVMVDREQGRQCPACGHRNGRGTECCAGCGYDLVERPRWACGERHRIHLDEGLCSCGRRLRRLPVSVGIGREIAVILKVGAWLLAFLVGMGILFELAG